MADPARLTVAADLSLLAANGEMMTVTANGRVIIVTLPRLWSRHWALNPLAGRSQGQWLLNRLQRALQVADLTLQVKVRQLVVAQLGPESQRTRLSRFGNLRC